MKLFYSLLFILTGLVYAETKDSLWVEFSGDTVKVWNAATLNCCSHINFEAVIDEHRIKLTEADTSSVWCKCNCDFNLCASLPGLKPGNYFVDVYRKFPYDSLIYVGKIEFNVPAPDTSKPFVSETFQSECLGSSVSNSLNSVTPKDSIFIEIISDTMKIWNYNVIANCCSHFQIETEINGYTIKQIETDTSMMLCNCMCTFNLSGSIVNLKNGKYNIEVYRISKYNQDTIYAGSAEVDYPGNSAIVKTYQSKCLNETEDQTIIYSNSFESSKDTVGWQGYMDFNSDAAPGCGTQSVHISGGCIWPHAWYVLPPLDESGYFIVRCWGKDLVMGGVAGIMAGSDYLNQALVSIHNTEWTYYESSDTLYCPSGERITIFLGSGGIIPSAMLIDKLEIWKITGSSIAADVNNENIASFELYQNYPNPFNPSTKIKYTIPFDYNGLSAKVELKVYDILGNMISILVDQVHSPGTYEVEFNGSDLSSGVYFYLLKVNENILHKKMCLIK